MEPWPEIYDPQTDQMRKVTQEDIDLMVAAVAAYGALKAAMAVAEGMLKDARARCQQK